MGLHNNFLKYFPVEKGVDHAQDISVHIKEDKKSEKIEPKISTAKKSDLEDEISGSSGGSHPLSVQKVSREGEEVVSVKLCDLPIDQIPGAIQKRKDDFGIWISRVALRHFESLKCKLAIDDDLFRKIENYFIPGFCEYGNNKWATPIDNAKKEELGICFGLQFTMYGSVRIHLSGTKDIEYFVTDFFEVFKPFLSDEEIIAFLEALVLERREKPVFYVHEARGIGPKKVIDEIFKGAHIKVNEIHWYGNDIKYDARIDYSEPMKPHIEAEGPMPQVGSFMKLFDGSPEAISNLSDIRELTYRTRDKVGDVYVGVGHLSHRMALQHQAQEVEFSELEARNQNRHLQNEIRFAGMKQEIKHYYSEYNKGFMKTTDSLINLSNDMKGIASGVSTLAEIQIDVKDEIHEKIDRRHNQAEQLIIETSNQVIDRLEQKIDSLESNLKKTLKTEFEKFSKKFRNNLRFIIKKLYEIPGLTAKSITDVMDRSKSSVYRYLKELQDHDIIDSYELKTKKKGRNIQFFRLSDKFKKKNKI